MTMEKSDAFIQEGDWVRLREPAAGCRYGRVLMAIPDIPFKEKGAAAIRLSAGLV
jgi:hypothetical protein